MNIYEGGFVTTRFTNNIPTKAIVSDDGNLSLEVDADELIVRGVNQLKKEFLIKMKRDLESGAMVRIPAPDWKELVEHIKRPPADAMPIFEREYLGVWTPNPNDDGLFSNEDISNWYRTFRENQKDSDVEVADDDLWNLI
jgi:hypothetical protein